MTRRTARQISRTYRQALDWASATEEHCLVGLVVLVYLMVLANLFVSKVGSLV